MATQNDVHNNHPAGEKEICDLRLGHHPDDLEECLSFSTKHEASVKKPLIILILLTAATHLQAETRYVTDQFKVTLRSGQSATHKIIRMLPSGLPVEIISSDRESGYSQVKTKDGTTGYILTRQLMEIPSARERLVKAEERLQELQQEPGRLSSKLSKLQTEFQKLTAAHQELRKEKDRTSEELQALKRTSANAVRIANERNDLRKQVATLTRTNAELEQENRELANNTNQRWFLIGGGVVVGGIILGLILPNLQMRRRKNNWGSL